MFYRLGKFGAKPVVSAAPMLDTTRRPADRAADLAWAGLVRVIARAFAITTIPPARRYNSSPGNAGGFDFSNDSLFPAARE